MSSLYRALAEAQYQKIEVFCPQWFPVSKLVINNFRYYIPPLVSFIGKTHNNKKTVVLSPPLLCSPCSHPISTCTYVHTTTFSRSTVSLAGPGDPFLLPFSGRKDMGGRVERGRNMRMGLFPYAKVERGGGGAEGGWVQEEKRGRISRWDEQQRQTHTGTYIA